jgi:hypothetical protein
MLLGSYPYVEYFEVLPFYVDLGIARRALAALGA